MRKFLIAALVAGLAWPMPAQAQDVLRLKPSTKWFLGYAEDSCRLARKFGEGDQQVTLFLDQFEPGDWFQMTLGGDVLRPKRHDGNRIGLKLRFGPSESATEIDANTGLMDDKRALIISSAQRVVPLPDADLAARKAAYESGNPPEPLPPIGPEREAAVTWIELSGGLRNDVILETGPMDQPLEALRKCSWDTVKLWGLEVDQQKTLTRKPRPEKGNKPWFTSDDYPRRMAWGGYEGVVNFRLLIDPTGKPTSCHIQTSTRPKEFDDAVCNAIMKRARFEPALDAQGKPVPSFYRQTVSFRLEKRPRRKS